ncbi:type II toxin-antitoxin system PemI/MazE family antitoxin (plasmid) [Oenococcus alcoholitolerans]|uniref:type II toxin-antitoxin system PemI/MazE family antitoxin n=1 Tax=Oenococcus alcoholitolerans TaxID=931074 RepID=UPI000AFD66BA
MLEVKTVTRGNSLALSLPAHTKFKFEKGQRWLMIPAEDNNSFILIPRMKDPYAGPIDSQPVKEEWKDFDFKEIE